MLDQPEQVKQEKPALTVIIQSWWTPALAVIMLVVGLLAGYFGRPLLNKGSASTGEPAAVITPTRQAQVEQLTEATPTIDPTLASINSQQQLMDYLISQTTHFEGDAKATVTIIEFSDYQ